MREGHIEDIRDASGTDDIIVVKQMTAFCVSVDGHVLFASRERSASRYGAHELSELFRVEGISECEQIGEEGKLGFVQIRERSEVSSLVNLVENNDRVVY